MIKLARPNISKLAIEKVIAVLKSGNLVQGKYVKEFEAALQIYLGVKHAVLVSSGTAALHLSLISLNIKAGDEVIIPAFTFPATANVVELVGAKPVFVDIKLDDFCINPTQIESKITEKTKAIIPVHEFGQSADMKKILEIAHKHKLQIIEDAACALGAEFNNQKVGTLGTLGCFSFHPRKAITTGEGGCVVTNDDRLADKIRSLRNHGISVDKGKIDFIQAGFNYRLTDFQAVLGLHQLTEIEDIIKQRIHTAKKHDGQLSTIKEVKIPPRLKNRKAVYQTYHVLLDDRINRDELISHLKDLGIETNLGAYALHCLMYYKQKYHYKDEDYPKTFQAFRHGLALPMGDHIKNKDISFIADKLRTSLKQST